MYLFIGECASRLGIGRQWASRLATRYGWEFILHPQGYRLYRWEQVVKVTPTPEQRQTIANFHRRAKGLARYAGKEKHVRETTTSG